MTSTVLMYGDNKHNTGMLIRMVMMMMKMMTAMQAMLSFRAE